MSQGRKQRGVFGTGSSGTGSSGIPAPYPPGISSAVLAALLLVLLGALPSGDEDRSAAPRILVENRSARARVVDVVWKSPGGAVHGSLLRVVEPRATLRHPLRAASAACVRWIDAGSASIEATWPVPAISGSRRVALTDGSNGFAAARPDCEPELAEHVIRPRLGRWMQPGEPGVLHRERFIPRAVHRRSVHRRGTPVDTRAFHG